MNVNESPIKIVSLEENEPLKKIISEIKSESCSQIVSYEQNEPIGET